MFEFEQALKGITILVLVILLLGLLIRKLNQPHFVAYIMAGVFLGPFGIRLFNEAPTIQRIGELGLVIHMFFVGLEIDAPSLGLKIKKPLIGLLSQLLLTAFFIFLAGTFAGFTFQQKIIFTFILSLSSSAIVFEYLKKNNELHSQLGQLTSGILILQDFMIVPFLLIINFMGSGELSSAQLILGAAVTILVILLFRTITLKRKLHLPFPEFIRKDHELQVFLGLLICFGCSWIASAVNLSASIGALLAGIAVSNITEIHWLQEKLMPFKIFFLSLFFVSVGLIIDIEFLLKHIKIIVVIVAVIFIINSVINAFIFRFLRFTWAHSWYAGALLSQIGEFSLVLILAANSLKLLDTYSYQLTLNVMALTMLLSSGWISLMRAFIFKEKSHLRLLLSRKKR